MQIYNQNIPASHLSHFKKSDLVSPPGININKVVEMVANQIALTIIHEAAHGKRWAQEFYTHKQRLQDMSRSKEESIAEQAEQRAGLPTSLTPEIYDPEQMQGQTMTNREILNRAIRISNSKNEFYIPVTAVEDYPLDEGTWGQFEMIQHAEPGQDASPHVAWDQEDRKLRVDVDAIVEEYNSALQNVDKQQPHPATHQTDGVEVDSPGVSQQPPSSAENAVPSVPAVPPTGVRQ